LTGVGHKDALHVKWYS